MHDKVVLITGASRGIGAAGGGMTARHASARRTSTLTTAASKGPIDTFTIGLAKGMAADGVRVNAVRVGPNGSRGRDRCLGAARNH